MKNILFFLSFILLNLTVVFSQQHVATYNFSGSCDDCYLTDNIWNTSHGSPYYYDMIGQGLCNTLLLESTSKGNLSEGAFIAFNFVKDKKYNFEVDIRDYKGSPIIEFYAANNLTNNPKTDCTQGIFPSNSDNVKIGHTYPTCDQKPGQLCTEYIPSKGTMWTATKNFNQLLISSHPNYPNGIIISKIFVYECGFFSGPPTNLQASVSGTNISLSWNRPAGDFVLKHYEIFCNGVKYTSTQNQYTISNLQECKDYEIKIRAIDDCDAVSPLSASINVQVFTKHANLELNNPINLSNYTNNRYVAQASETVFLKPGFSVKSNNAQDFFKAMIGCDDDSSIKFESDDEELYLTDEENTIETVLSVFSSISGKEIRIYPNPTTGILSIDSEELLINLEIFDIIGKPVLSFKPTDSTFKIDISKFAAGVYFIKIVTHENVFERKLIKM